MGIGRWTMDERRGTGRGEGEWVRGRKEDLSRPKIRLQEKGGRVNLAEIRRLNSDWPVKGFLQDVSRPAPTVRQF
jgi:hypothetical protein